MEIVIAVVIAVVAIGGVVYSNRKGKSKREETSADRKGTGGVRTETDRKRQY